MNTLYTTQHNAIVMKSEPRHRADTVSYMLLHELCEILEQDTTYIGDTTMNKNFVRIKLQHDGYEGYVLRGQLDVAGSNRECSEKIVRDKELLLLHAHKYMGAPYLRGGRMETGIDCSGLTQILYEQYDIKLLRDAYQQATQGIPVLYEHLETGDLLFFTGSGNSEKISHVGIYISPGRILHASEQGSANVRIDDFNEQGIPDNTGEIVNILKICKRVSSSF